ncbi:polymorphic toxin-type HINT domain-containing protein [Flammeovirga pectinis]|uniref:polymorphic toxin-type HINT domain-containing protein n=1 Tax=Flammeovirga pectinis TaxID=2494373 RepID=UPI001F0B83BB|nr:polymorphic toxin-type HINT domain-containing protein [Flammeovirga pectinis]
MFPISTTTYFVSKKIDQRKKAQLTKFVTEIGEVSEDGFTKADRFFSICRKLGLTDADKEVVERFLKPVGVGEDKIPSIMRHFCFPAGTQIFANGKPFKPIEKIVIGDYVDTKNDQGKRVLAKVVSTKVSFTDSLVILYHGNKKLLTSTPNHRIYTPAGFKKARDFIEGDEIEDVHGELLSIDSIHSYASDELVYNFEVEGFHSYYADGVYVHNEYGLPQNIAKKLDDLKLDDKLKEAF